MQECQTTHDLVHAERDVQRLHVFAMTASDSTSIAKLGLTGPRAPQLDGLRGVAILMVVIYHSTELSYSEVPWIRAVLFAPWMGWAFESRVLTLRRYAAFKT